MLQHFQNSCVAGAFQTILLSFGSAHGQLHYISIYIYLLNDSFTIWHDTEIEIVY
jgi:hypothetical protein